MIKHFCDKKTRSPWHLLCTL